MPLFCTGENAEGCGAEVRRQLLSLNPERVGTSRRPRLRYGKARESIGFMVFMRSVFMRLVLVGLFRCGILGFAGPIPDRGMEYSIRKVSAGMNNPGFLSPCAKGRLLLSEL